MKSKYLWVFFSVIFLANSCEKKAPQEALAIAPPAFTVSFVQNASSLVRGGQESPLSSGAVLHEGDIIISPENGSAELNLGGRASVRLMPGTEISLRALQTAGRLAAEIFLKQGTILVKAAELEEGESLIAETPDLLSAVRGTLYMVSYDASGSGLAVREGEVAFLPEEILQKDGVNHKNELLSIAPKVGKTQSIVIDGSGPGLRRVEEPGREAAAEAAAEAVAEALRDFRPRPLTGAEREILALLDHVADPGTGYSPLEAAFPERVFRPRKSPPKPEDEEKEPGEKEPVKKEPVKKEPEPLLWNREVSSAALTGLDWSGSVLLALDAQGRAFGISQDGAVLWTYGEGGAALSGAGGQAALVDSGGLSLLDSSTGRLLGRASFGGWGALPQTKGVPVSEGIAITTPRGVAICRLRNAELIREIPVAGGIITTLVPAERELLAINGSGRLVILDVASGSIRLEAQVEMGKKAYAPLYYGGTAYLSNQDGLLAAVDIKSGETVWEARIDEGLQAEPQIDSERLYIWTRAKRLLRLSRASGADLGNPQAGVESAPLLAQGMLFWGAAGGILVRADPRTGSVVKRTPVPGSTAARPLLVGSALYIGTSTGRLIKLDKEYL